MKEKMDDLDSNGLLKAMFADMASDGTLLVDDGVRPIQMRNSDGTGTPLFSLNGFGADIIRFAAGEGVGNHTHLGDHILFTLKGSGVVEYEGVEHNLFPGVSYLIPGSVDHAIRARENLVLIAVGNNHYPLDSDLRMNPVQA